MLSWRPVDDPIERARGIAADPVGTARDVKARTGRPVVGMVSSWVPDAIVLAAGGIPLRLPAVSGRRTTRAGAHFQSSSCHYARGVLEMGLDGTLDFVDAIFFVQSCDTQQNLSDIWKAAVPRIPAVDLYMPVNRRSASARAYLLAEIERAGAEIGRITGTPVAPGALDAALEERAGVEGAMADLYEARLECAGRVRAESFHAACIASSCLPPAEARPIVEAAAGAVRSGGIVEPVGSPDIACALLGSVIPFPGMFRLLDVLEVPVRDDDLSLGRRLFDHPVPAAGEPFERLAVSLLERSPGATKHDEGMDRGERVVEMARRARAKHVVLPILKFCDPWAWEVPRVRAKLARAGIGMLLVEIGGEEDMTTGPVRTRVEAYFEMDRVGDLFDA